MKNAAEIDKRVRGTEYASMLDPKAAPQRSGRAGDDEQQGRHDPAAARRTRKRRNNGPRASG